MTETQISKCLNAPSFLPKHPRTTTTKDFKISLAQYFPSSFLLYKEVSLFLGFCEIEMGG